MSESKNVLIVVSIMGQFPEMFRLAQVLKTNSNYNPIIYFNLGVNLRHPNVVTCLNSGIDVLDYNKGYFKGRVLNIPSSSSSGSSLMPKVKGEKKSFRQFVQFVRYEYPRLFYLLQRIYYYRPSMWLPPVLLRISVMKRRIKQERKYFNQLQVKLLVFAEDSVGYYTPLLIRIGHQKNVKSVVFPYTFANRFEFLEDADFNDRRVNRNLYNYLAGTFFPKWTYQYKGKNLLKSQPELIFAAEHLKIAPPNPWVMSSGTADVIAVESEFMKNYYATAGIPSEKMVDTGFVALDSLYQSHHQKDVRKAQLAIDPQKIFVLCAVPPTQWPRTGAGFKSYDQFLKEFFSFLGQFKDVEIIYKFHPRLEVSEIQKLANKYKINYSLEDTADLIGVSDIYIASVSSTIRWALALGIPTINYDLYQYNYQDFEGAGQYITVTQFVEFQTQFKAMLSSFRSLRPQTYYGLLDGNAQQRIFHLFDNLTAVNPGL